MKTALVVGGTGLIGTAVAAALERAGWWVTVLHRGNVPDTGGPDTEVLIGDRDQGTAGLEALGIRWWNAVVDVCGYTPGQMRPLLDRVKTTERFCYISAVMVYGDAQQRPVTEAQALLAPAQADQTEVNGETYGPLKVACETLVRGQFRDRATVIRPQSVVGKGDRSERLSYWFGKVANGGEVVIPGDGTDHVQVLDVNDLAHFVVRVLEDDRGGTFHLAGPRVTWAEFARLLGIQKPRWTSFEVLESEGRALAEFPLFRPERGLYSGLMDLDTSRARAAGFRITDLDQTLATARRALGY